MKTAQKVWIIILSVAFVISAAALGLSYFAPDVLTDGGFKGESAENVTPQKLMTEYPLVQSDFDNIFYCLRYQFVFHIFNVLLDNNFLMKAQESDLVETMLCHGFYS